MKELVADYARRLHARGWVANHDGNVSLRQADGTFLITPTATSKAEITADSLLVVDDKGAVLDGGRGKPFSEWSLHRVVFAARPDVRAVIHAHPPTATGFAVAGVPLDEPFLAEAVVSLGRAIPTVPFAPPGDAAAAALRPFCQYDAVLLGNHGVLAWGSDVEQAYLRLELVEQLARVALVARQLGGIVPLPESSLAALLAARKKAGLGPEARDPVEPTKLGPTDRVVACAPPPPDASVSVYQPDDDLARIIRQEIARALADSR